jgi:hypothetical protein
MLGFTTLAGSPVAGDSEDLGLVNATVAATFPKFTALLSAPVSITATIEAQFPFAKYSQASIAATFPKLEARFIGEVLPPFFNTGIRATFPRMTALLYGGAQMKATFPLMTAAITATVRPVATINATFPRMTAALVVMGGSAVSIVARFPKMTALVYGGGRIVAAFPKLTAAVDATVGTAISITANFPMLTGSMQGFAGSVATINATFPMLVASGFVNNIVATFPRMRALIVANASAYTVSDAYVLTLNNDKKPVTRYTNYPFHSIVRRGDSYLAFGPAGAFELAGIDDAGAPIAWAFKFGPTVELPGDEFGQGVVKRNEGTYWTGRFSGTVTASAAVDDGTTYEYAKDAVTDNMDCLRIPIGRGLSGFAWEFGLSGEGALDMRRAEFLQRATKRKVRHG